MDDQRDFALRVVGGVNGGIVVDTVIQFSTFDVRIMMFLALAMIVLFFRCLQVMGKQYADNQKLWRRLNGMHIHSDALKRRNAQLEAAWVWDAGEPAPPIAGAFDEN